MKNRNLLSFLLIATTSVLFNVHAQSGQQPMSQIGQQPNNWQQSNNWQQQNTVLSQISYLGTDQGIAWQAAPQYAQPNTRAFTASVQGRPLVLQVSMNQGQVNFIVVDLQTKQQVIIGNGQMTDARHIQLAYREVNGAQGMGMWHINHMPNQQSMPYPPGGFVPPNSPRPNTQNPYSNPPTGNYPNNLNPYPTYPTLPTGGYNSPDPYDAKINQNNEDFRRLIGDEMRHESGDGNSVYLPSGAGSSSWINTNTGEYISNDDPLYDPNADLNVDSTGWEAVTPSD